jgi:peptidoglycan hydrolase-like protein with peptidoglycan-binding domain
MSLRVSGSSAAPSRAAEIATRAPAVDRTATAQPSRSTGTGTATGSLRHGSRGEDVRSLQNQLRSAGFNPGRSDGIFGPRTERALRNYQSAMGLKNDGIAGRRTFAALNGPDSFEPSRPGAQGGVNGTNGTQPNRPAAQAGVNGTARLNGQPNGKGMTNGTITVNGNTYQFNSGSGSKFSVPQGEYRVTAHRNSRSEAAFSRDGVGFSFLIEDARRPGSDAMYDRRAGRDRTALRIHPDGGAVGTAGCIGILGDAATMRRFRDDMNAELRRNGGAYTLRVQ